MRRLSDRARLEGMLALRKALETVRRVQPRLSTALEVAPEPCDDALDAKWWQRADDLDDAPRILAAVPDAPVSTRETGVAGPLDRIAGSLDRIAAQLDSSRAERAQHLDAIEFLLREMVIGTVQPTAASAVVHGGVVGPVDLAADDITIIPDGAPLGIDTSVEVRSRFHDRWISGFAIAEAIDTPGRLRYRLTRRSDGIPLPILFDACDVRAAGAVNAYDQPPASRTRA